MKESKPLTYCKCMCTCKEPNIFGVSETAQTKDTSTTKNVKEPVCSLIAGWLTISKGNKKSRKWRHCGTVFLSHILHHDKGKNWLLICRLGFSLVT